MPEPDGWFRYMPEESVLCPAISQRGVKCAAFTGWVPESHPMHIRVATAERSTTLRQHPGGRSICPRCRSWLEFEMR